MSAVRLPIVKTLDVEEDLSMSLSPILTMLKETPTSRWIAAGNDVKSWMQLATNPPVGYHRLFSIVCKPVPEPVIQDDGMGTVDRILNPFFEPYELSCEDQVRAWDPDNAFFTSQPSFTTTIHSRLLARLFISVCQETSLESNLKWASYFDAIPIVKGLLFETLALRTLSFNKHPSPVMTFHPEQVMLNIPPLLPAAKRLMNLDVCPEPDLLHCASRKAATFNGLYYSSTGNTDVVTSRMTFGSTHGITDLDLHLAFKTFAVKRRAEDLYFFSSCQPTSLESPSSKPTVQAT